MRELRQNITHFTDTLSSNNQIDVIMNQIHKNMQEDNCWLMDPEMIIPMSEANWVIAISYFIIPVVIVITGYLFRNLLYGRSLALAAFFVLFILICGYGHIVKVQNFWWGNFKYELIVDQITAGISAVSALLSLYFSFQIIRGYYSNPARFKKAVRQILRAVKEIHKAKYDER